MAEKGLVLEVKPPPPGQKRSYYSEFEAIWAAYIATVPEENRHLICGELRTLAWQDDPEEQEKNSKSVAWLMSRETTEKKKAKKGKRS